MAASKSVEDAMRFRNRFPAATNDVKAILAAHSLANYRLQEWKSDSLSKFFSEEFCIFSEEDFNAIDYDTRQKLRNPLRKRVVFVPKGRNTSIAVAL